MNDTAPQTSQAVLDQLLNQLDALNARVEELEARLQAVSQQPPPPHVVLAISAACAAYIGKRAVVKQVRLHRGQLWAIQGWTSVQQSHTLNPTHRIPRG